MLINVVSCSRQSRRANFPSSSFLAMAFCLSGLAIATSCLWIGRRREHDRIRGGKGPRGSYICSNNPCISPMPRSLEMKGEGTNRSRSLKCSPTPKKMIGVLVAATLYDHTSQVRVISACPVWLAGHQENHAYSRRDRSTSLGVSVQFRDDDRTEIRTLLERPTLPLGRLTDRGIENHDRHVLSIQPSRSVGCSVQTG